MAARENQGLQIALIIFAILTVGLGVTTYVFFDKFQEQTTVAAKNSDQARTAQADSDNAKAETAEMKTLIGAEAAESLKDIQERHKKDMEAYGKSLPEAKKHYRQLIEYMSGQVRSKDNVIVTEQDQKRTLEGKIKSDETTRVAEIGKYSQQASVAVKDKDTERDKFTADRAKFQADTQALAKSIEDQRKKFEDDVKKLNADIEQYVSDIKKLDTDKRTLLKERDVIAVSGSAIDGKITWVNQRARLVWLDLGASDGLKQQITFAVLPAGEAGSAEEKTKGNVEVTRVVGPHLAEARIIDDDARNPLMPGDQVLSSAWEPGRAEHFALAGVMDIDGNGLSDRKLVRDLVLLNGGVIDAELDDEGNLTGEVTVSTRFLILGQRPTEAAVKRDREKGELLLKNYSKMIEQAAKSGVQTLNVDSFFKHVGYDARQRTVPLGKGARPEDFKPSYPDGIQRKSTGKAFDYEPRMPLPKRKAAPKRDAAEEEEQKPQPKADAKPPAKAGAKPKAEPDTEPKADADAEPPAKADQ